MARPSTDAAKQPRQHELVFRSWGGKRVGAGRPRKSEAGVSHDGRPKLSRHHPVHVTLRVREHVWNLRSRRSLRVFEAAVAAAHAAAQAHGGEPRNALRVVHFSLQGNHLHLIVEAGGSQALSRGVQGLTVRLAKGLNRMMGRSGKVFEDRYHAHALKTPAEVRNALAYVLLNHRSHRARDGERLAYAHLDPFSSAAAFDGWKAGAESAGAAARTATEARETARSGEGPAVPATRTAAVRATTWLLMTGWRRHGLLSLEEVPAHRFVRRSPRTHEETRRPMASGGWPAD